MPVTTNIELLPKEKEQRSLIRSEFSYIQWLLDKDRIPEAIEVTKKLAARIDDIGA